MKLKDTAVIGAKVISAGLLFAALGQRRYGYYVYLRWVVCGVAGVSAYQAFRRRKPAWGGLLTVLALLFNPIIPFHLGRDNWVIVDAFAALLLLLSVIVNFHWRQPKG